MSQKEYIYWKETVYKYIFYIQNEGHWKNDYIDTTSYHGEIKKIGEADKMLQML